MIIVSELLWKKPMTSILPDLELVLSKSGDWKDHLTRRMQ